MLVLPAPGASLSCEPACGLRPDVEQPEVGAARGGGSWRWGQLEAEPTGLFSHELQAPILLNKKDVVTGKTYN